MNELQERHIMLFALVGLLWVSGPHRVNATVLEKAPPNVILIMADDVSYDHFGSYGSEYFSTPNLDELARAGIQFNQCYSQPVCTASRVQIMTGRFNARNYVEFGALAPGEATFGLMMQSAG